MRRTLLATAAVSLLAFGASAQQAAQPADPAPAVAPMAPAVAGGEPVTADGSAAATTATPVDPPSSDVGPVVVPVKTGDISADKLMGATIKTADGENVATVEDVLVGADGVMESVVAQFGGFLGFGSNKVLLAMNEIEVMQDEAGNLVVHTALTPESLEGRPEYQDDQ